VVAPERQEEANIDEIDSQEEVSQGDDIVEDPFEEVDLDDDIVALTEQDLGDNETNMFLDSHFGTQKQALINLSNEYRISGGKSFYVARLMTKQVDEVEAKVLRPRYPTSKFKKSVDSDEYIEIKLRHIVAWARRHGYPFSLGTRRNHHTCWNTDKAQLTLTRLSTQRNTGDNSVDLANRIRLLTWIITGEELPLSPAAGTLESLALRLSMKVWKRLCTHGELPIN
jgi:hypothetical protein